MKTIGKLWNSHTTGVGLLVAFGIAGAGCDFDATDPTRITAEDLDTDAAMTALMVGTISTYDAAYDRQVLFSGVLSDEYTASGSWPAWHLADKEGIIDIDTPESDHMNMPWRLWREMQRARVAAEETYGRMEGVVADVGSDYRAAMMRLYEGLAYTDLGEMFCEVAFDESAAMPPSASFDRAHARLDDAVRIANAAGVDSIVHMANLVRARIHMEQGDHDAALAAARAVPTGLHWVAHFRDSSGERSQMWFQNHDRGEASVHPAFRDTGDPRTPVHNQGRVGPDTETVVWANMKYPTYNSDVIVGKWQEARLIEAEILIDRGDTGAAIDAMNEVREAAGLEPFAATLSSEEAWEAMERERAHELWLEGRRWVDMRRWGFFPTGWDTCMPIPREERDSNPNL